MNGIAPGLRRLLGATAAASLLAGCDSRSQVEEVKQMLNKGDPVLATTRVENGVTVYEHAPDAFNRAPQWTLDTVPVSIIGAAEGDAQFDLTRVSYVVPLSDGRVMTFARVGNKVFVFGRDGKGERVIGRTGQGPGDWMRFGDPMLLENDTVLVLDFANQRLNWVTADKGIVRTAPYEVSGDMRRTSNVGGFLSTGELLLHSAHTWGGHKTDSLQRSLARVTAANIITGQIRDLATIPDLQGAQVETRFRGRVRNEWQPVRLSGSALLTAWDSVFAAALASSPEIELRDATGASRARVEVPAHRRAVTSAMRDARIALELAWLNAPGGEGLVDAGESQRLAREAPFADSLPYFEHLFTGSDRTLWVVDAMAPSDTGWTATAFWKDGSLLARLTVKEKSTPMAFGAGQVIVRTENEDGVVMLRVYRFGPVGR